MNKMIKLISVSLCLLLCTRYNVAMQDQQQNQAMVPVNEKTNQKQQRVGLPSHFSWVPYSNPCSTTGFFNMVSPVKIGRPELYSFAALRLGESWKKRPVSLAQMALADGAYEAVDGVFKFFGGNLLKSPNPIQKIAVHGTRLAAYTLGQKSTRKFFPTLADPLYEINIDIGKRDAGEDIVTATLVLGAVIFAKKTGLSDRIFKCVSKLFVGGLKKLFKKEAVDQLCSSEGSMLGKILFSLVAYSIGGSIIHRNIVGPVAEKLFALHPRLEWARWSALGEDLKNLFEYNY